MEYASPEVEVVGKAKELVQAFAGPRQDGNGQVFSQGFLHDTEE